MCEAYNPAEDEKKLREFLDPERLYYDIDLPNRWVRCLAAKILEQNKKIKELEGKVDCVKKSFNLINKEN